MGHQFNHHHGAVKHIFTLDEWVTAKKNWDDSEKWTHYEPYRKYRLQCRRTIFHLGSTCKPTTKTIQQDLAFPWDLLLERLDLLQ